MNHIMIANKMFIIDKQYHYTTTGHKTSDTSDEAFMSTNKIVNNIYRNYKLSIDFDIMDLGDGDIRYDGTSDKFQDFFFQIKEIHAAKRDIFDQYIPTVYSLVITHKK